MRHGQFDLSLFLICGVAFCQSPPAALPDGVYRPGNGVSSPKVLSSAGPGYSEEARMARLAGTVLVSIVVGEDGRVREARATASPGLGLDEKAIEAVSSWRFQPGLKDGRPVAVALTVEVNFHNSVGYGQWALARAVFDVAEGATRPVLTSAPYPQTYSTSGPGGSVSISFDVDPTGTTANLHIEKSSDPGLEKEVIAIVREWRFQAGVTPVRCTMEFVKANGNSLQ